MAIFSDIFLRTLRLWNRMSTERLAPHAERLQFKWFSLRLWNRMSTERFAPHAERLRFKWFSLRLWNRMSTERLAPHAERLRFKWFSLTDTTLIWSEIAWYWRPNVMVKMNWRYPWPYWLQCWGLRAAMYRKKKAFEYRCDSTDSENPGCGISLLIQQHSYQDWPTLLMLFDLLGGAPVFMAIFEFIILILYATISCWLSVCDFPRDVCLLDIWLPLRKVILDCIKGEELNELTNEILSPLPLYCPPPPPPSSQVEHYPARSCKILAPCQDLTKILPRSWIIHSFWRHQY